MEILSKVHAKHLVTWAKERPQVVVLSADLTSSTEIDLFRDCYPERFFSMGMTEQNMLSVAGGLAREGYVPFIHTFAVFMYRRALDQLAMSIAYPNLPVRLVGFLPGIMTPGGVTHQAIEDVAIIRAIPNMTILECGDATDVESVLDVTETVSGPVYIRMLRGEIPRLFPQNQPMRLNRSRLLSEGSDVTLLSSGICTEEALRAIAVLQQRGVGVEHRHVSTLKPFTDPELLGSLEKSRYGVITMENHTVIGGLGSAVAELMTDHGLGRRLIRMGLPDQFAHGASPRYLLREYHMDARGLVDQVEALVGTSLHIGDEELEAVRIESGSPSAKAEEL